MNLNAKIYDAHHGMQARMPLPRNVEPFVDPHTVPLRYGGIPNRENEASLHFNWIFFGLILAALGVEIGAVYLAFHREIVIHLWRVL